MNDLSLPVLCVSRLHALLRVTADGLEIEDQGSTNGTWIGNQRTERGVACAGEVVRFGPVSMRVESLGVEESQLAIDLAPERGDGAPDPDLEQVKSTDPFGGFDLMLIDRFVTRLGNGDSEGALAAAGRRLRARCAFALEWRGETEPTVLVAWGRIDEFPIRSTMRRLLAGRPRTSARRRGKVVVREPQLIGVLRWGGARGVGLLFWRTGDSSDRSVQLVNALLSLIDHLILQPVPASMSGDPAPRQRDPSLSFPTGTGPGARLLRRRSIAR